jgi:predicted ATPase/DNA-binding CsgD family transcriptional regulator
MSAEPGAFVGRVEELAATGSLLLGARLLTLTGSAGCGKTRLAERLAVELAERHPDGVCWVDLAAVGADSRVTKTVASALELREEGGRPLLGTVIRHCRDRRLLLVLDNCEGVGAGTAALATALLAGAPAITILATSRRPLRVHGEAAWRMPSMSLPPETPGGAGLDDPAASDALRLFVARAGQHSARAGVDAAGIAAAARICRRLDGIPLAIELAAARTATQSPDEIAAGLEQRFHLLTGGERTALPRQRTVRTAIEWSADLLPVEDRLLWRRLSVFVGGFSTDAAHAVCGGARVDSPRVEEMLAHLEEAALIFRNDRDHPGRRRMLEGIREVARDQAVGAGDAERDRSRHLRHFLELAQSAESAGPFGPPEERWLERMEREHSNLHAAMEWALASGDADAALQLSSALAFFWALRGHFEEAHDSTTRALAGGGAASPQLRARALWSSAHCAWYAGDASTTASAAAAALEQARPVGDTATMARALNALAKLAIWIDPAKSREGIVESIRLAEASDDGWCLADSVETLAWTHVNQDDHAAARPLFERALALSAEHGNRHVEAWCWLGQGVGTTHRGDFAQAKRELTTATAVAIDAGDIIVRGSAQATLAWVHRVMGDLDTARRLLVECLDVVRDSGTVAIAWLPLRELCAVDLDRGDVQAAAHSMQRALTMVEQIGNTYGFAYCLLGSADVALARGDTAGAVTALEQAMEAARHIGNTWMVAAAQQRLGHVARRAGDLARANGVLQEALAVQAKAGRRPGTIDVLDELAAVAIAFDNPRVAAQLLCAVDAAREQIGYARTAAEASVHAERRERCSGALGDEWQVLCAGGARMTLDDAVHLARDVGGGRRRPAGWASLTPTELDVVNLVAAGLSNNEIAQRMSIARGTVKAHLGHVFSKLGVATRSELAASAVRHEIAEPSAAT